MYGNQSLISHYKQILGPEKFKLIEDCMAVSTYKVADKNSQMTIVIDLNIY